MKQIELEKMLQKLSEDIGYARYGKGFIANNVVQNFEDEVMKIKNIIIDEGIEPR